jgi:hypothetical protein
MMESSFLVFKSPGSNGEAIDNCHGRASDLSFVICRVESLKGPAPDVRTGVRSQKMLVSYGSENGYT